MSVVNVPVFQGHPVPARPYAAQGPFNRELLTKPVVLRDYTPEADGGGLPVPEGGTAQNGYQAVRWFRCRECREALRENEIEEHECAAE